MANLHKVIYLDNGCVRRAAYSRIDQSQPRYTRACYRRRTFHDGTQLTEIVARACCAA